MRLLWHILGLTASAYGILHRAYLVKVYLPLVLNGQDMSKLSARLANSDRRETQIILHAMGARIDPTAYVESHLFVHNARTDYANLCVGPGAYIGRDCFLDLSEEITLEQNVTLGARVAILTHFNAGNSTVKKYLPTSCAPVRIKEGAYIGSGVIILPGITIGADALVAAGAVVTENVPPRYVMGGIPARIIKPITALNANEGALAFDDKPGG